MKMQPQSNVLDNSSLQKYQPNLKFSNNINEIINKYIIENDFLSQ